MEVKGILVPDLEPLDEKTDEFKVYLKSQLRLDPIYLKSKEELGDDPTRKQLRKIEYELRDRIRAARNMVPVDRETRPQIKIEAEKVGINPSYELLVTKYDCDESDKIIQTLKYDDDLEIDLSSLFQFAELAESETGTLPLYLAFGFLEWYESDASDKALNSPLLLLPIEIKRVNSANGIKFYIGARDFEPIANLSLMERLKSDFGMIIPKFNFSSEDGEVMKPSDYFKKVETIISEKKDWKIHSWATVSIFSFSKLAMYNELNSENLKSISTNLTPLESMLLSQGNVDENHAFSADYEIENPEFRLKIPKLITSADVSQISAIMDVIDGNNLVIEGPPGTGKSQTITNIIAALIGQGKRVLFVAEKRAALTVVKERLSSAKLGPFCLELHSSKAKRKEVIDSLEKRLKVRRDHAAENLVADLEKQIHSIKSELGKYISELNQSHSPLDISLHEIVWKYISLNQFTLDKLLKIQKIKISNPQLREKYEIESIKLKLERLNNEYNEFINPYDTLAKHPWNKMLPKGMLLPHVDVFIEEFTTIKNYIVQIYEDLISIEDNLKVKSLQELEQINELIRAINVHSSNDFSWAIPILDKFGTETIPILLKTEEYKTELKELKSKITSGAPGFFKHNKTGTQLSSFFDLLRRQGYFEKSTSEVKQISSGLNIAKDNIETAVGSFQTISKILNLKISTNLENVKKVDELCKVIISCPKNIWDIKNEDVLREPLREAFLELMNQRKLLISKRHQLSKSANLELCSKFNLYRYSNVLSSSNILSWFDSEYRTIKKDIKNALHNISDDRLASEELYRVEKLFNEENRFDQNPTLSRIFSSSYNLGISSNFDVIMNYISWYEKLKLYIIDHGFDAEVLSRVLELDKITMAEIVRLQLNNSFNFDIEPISPRESLENKLSQIGLKIRYLNEILDFSKECEFDSNIKFSSLENLLLTVAKYERSIKKNSEGSINELLIHFPSYDDYSERGAIDSLINVIKCMNKLLLDDVKVKSYLLNGFSDWSSASLHKFSNIDSNKAKVITQIANLKIDHHDYFDLPIYHLAEKMKYALLYKDSAFGLVTFQDTLTDLEEHDLEEFLPVVIDQKFFGERLNNIFDFCFYNSLVNYFTAGNPRLFKAISSKFDEYRHRYKELDDKLFKANQSLLSTKLCDNRPPEGIGAGRKRDYTEMSLIKHLTTLDRPNVSVRELLIRSSNAVTSLKPVFLMSPLSVAEILPSNLKFDVLIMDEASQMKPEDAIGSVARCSQVIVVGDPKQMPPSDYFSRTSQDDDGSEETDFVDIHQESILDLALGAFSKPRRLRWHYRSKSEELIAFSNHYFYENDLVIFPSAKTHPHQQGVVFEKVNGVYNAGLNKLEAKAAVNFVISLMKERPSSSIMLVAMNQKQSELLNDLLMEAIAQDSILEKYVDYWKDTLEPLLVRNLENVQGDERDIVVISTVYGPDSNGHVFQRFGPIGSAYGHRRLNVLYTRAKELMVVVASMDDSAIVVGPSSSRGVSAFKNFLKFARTKQLGSEVTSFGSRPPDSDFEIHVANKIKEKLPGLEVVAQVGVAGFFIDLAIKHPNKNDAFLIGIECDGKNYHSSKSARDRDKIRQKILENLGWRLHRIWSTDWYLSPEREVSKLIIKIESLIEQDKNNQSISNKNEIVIRSLQNESIVDLPEVNILNINHDNLNSSKTQSLNLNEPVKLTINSKKLNPASFTRVHFLDELRELNFEVMDNRPDGALWVIDCDAFRSAVDILKGVGIIFKFKSHPRSTGRRAAWYLDEKDSKLVATAIARLKLNAENAEVVLSEPHRYKFYLNDQIVSFRKFSINGSFEDWRIEVSSGSATVITAAVLEFEVELKK